MEKTIRLEESLFIIGEYAISGNGDSDYIVYDDNNSEVYNNTSFEKCVVWCLNS